MVNYLDLGTLATNYDQSSCAWRDGDFNDDGKVNYLDLGVLATNYGAGTGGAAAVPEPAGMMLLALAGLVPLRRRRRP